MAIAAVGLGACDDRRPQPLTIDNALTADEIAAGRLTPEVMWKMSRAGSSSLSPDGKTLLYAQTDYNMAQNRGVTTIWVQDMASGAVTRLTDTASNNAAPEWSSDGRKIYFLSDRSGSMQVWRMNAAGGDATQVTGSGGGEGVPDVEGFGVSPDEKHIWWVQAVQTARRKSSDVYKDMDKSKARIYDDLMARHWDYWDEGSYRHIFIGELRQGPRDGRHGHHARCTVGRPAGALFRHGRNRLEQRRNDRLAYTCKPLTGTEYAVSTDSDIFVYVLRKRRDAVNICKPVNGHIPGDARRKRQGRHGRLRQIPRMVARRHATSPSARRRTRRQRGRTRQRLYAATTAARREIHRPHARLRLPRHQRRLGGRRPHAVVHRADRGERYQLCRLALPALDATCGTGEVPKVVTPRRPRHQRLLDGRR